MAASHSMITSIIGDVLRKNWETISDPNHPVPHRKHWAEQWYDKMRGEGWKYAIRPHRPGFITGDDEAFFAQRAAGLMKRDDWRGLPWVKRLEAESGTSFTLSEIDKYTAERFVMHDKWVMGYLRKLSTPDPHEPREYGPWLPLEHEMKLAKWLRLSRR